MRGGHPDPHPLGILAENIAAIVNAITVGAIVFLWAFYIAGGWV